MNAKEFIKKFGWEVSTRLQQEMKGITEQVADCVAGWGQSEWDNLKQYIDAYELVQSLDGLESAKAVLRRGEFEDYDYLNQAINLIKEI